MGLLDGKVVVITGAGNGIGRAHALAFAREGAKVLVNDIGAATDGEGRDPSVALRVVEEIRAAGGTAEANVDSVATAAGAEAMIAAAEGAFGRVDVLVNNAGILRDKSILKMDDESFDAVLAVHLKGAFFAAQAFARRIIPRVQAGGEGGRIINTTSASGLLGNFGQVNYAAAKAGIFGLTKTLAIELQKHKITVNAIAPLAKTRMTESLPMFQTVTSLRPEHVAPAAIFLGSELCAARTGWVLGVAGARMYAFKLVESPGSFKEGEDDVWTAQEIATHWDAIVKG
jgi:NAD(P)-dependent dehydrogenase (short-subunit alcohol dehydrogenase family)